MLLTLDHGEREAIQLAIETKSDSLIMDEWAGREAAKSRGLPLIGALGILGDSYRLGLIEKPLAILADMKKCGFRINDAVLADFEVRLRAQYRRRG